MNDEVCDNYVFFCGNERKKLRDDAVYIFCLSYRNISLDNEFFIALILILLKIVRKTTILSKAKKVI